jgi:hypothetical protein
MQALVAAGVTGSDASITAALGYLTSQQTGDAGFAWDKTSPWYTGSDANSTALVIQGLVSVNPSSLDGWSWARSLTETGQITLTVHTPTERLLDLQLPGGAFEWQPGAYGGPNYLATVQAIPALAERAFPWEHSRLDMARSALTWLEDRQEATGAFGGADSLTTTAQAVLAGVALGQDADAWSVGQGNPTAIGYLLNHVYETVGDAEATGMLLSAAMATEMDPLAFGGHNLLAQLLVLNEGSGQYAATTSGQAWAMIGLAAARYPVPSAAVTALEAMQAAGGNWPGVSASEDTYATALALQALAAAGASAERPSVVAGLAYLKARQTANGGFSGHALSTTSDAAATAAAIQAILALGGEPRSAAWLVNGRSPLDDLAGQALWGPGANVLTTARAVPALLLEVNPLRTWQAAVAVNLALVY